MFMKQKLSSKKDHEIDEMLFGGSSAAGLFMPGSKLQIATCVMVGYMTLTCACTLALH